MSISNTQSAIARRSPIKVEGYFAGEDTGVSYAYFLVRLFFLVAKFFQFLVLLALLMVTFVVWIWIVSFRGGWYLWEWIWANRSKTDQKIAAGLWYGLIISVVAPFVLFFNWAQELLKQARLLPESFPSQINLVKVVEKHLEIDLGSQFPYLLKSKENVPTGNSSSTD